MMSLGSLVLVFFNIFVLTIFITAIVNNSSMNKQQRNSFIYCSITLIIMIITELSTLLLDGSPLQFRWLHITTNYLGFAITPTIVLFLANSVLPSKRIYPLAVFLLSFAIWIFISQFTGHSVFYVDSQNNYHRDDGFVVYVLTYIVCIIAFFYENRKFSLKYKPNNFLLVGTVFFVIAGTTIQLINPDIHITCFSITITVIMYYIYHESMIQKIDAITTLMNYNSFLRFTSESKTDLMIIVLEIDNFRKFQMNYNRNIANNSIKTLAENIQEFYQRYGLCFRIGTDEFCVLCSNLNLDYDSINRNFFKRNVQLSFSKEYIPLVSIGYAKYSAGDNINQVLSEADKKKKAFIADRISLLYM